jgi:hypothetical protein
MGDGDDFKSNLPTLLSIMGMITLNQTYLHCYQHAHYSYLAYMKNLSRPKGEISTGRGNHGMMGVTSHHSRIH